MSDSFIQFLVFLFVLGLVYFGDPKSKINKASKFMLAFALFFWLVVKTLLEIKDALGW